MRISQMVEVVYNAILPFEYERHEDMSSEEFEETSGLLKEHLSNCHDILYNLEGAITVPFERRPRALQRELRIFDMALLTVAEQLANSSDWLLLRTSIDLAAFAARRGMDDPRCVKLFCNFDQKVTRTLDTEKDPADGVDAEFSNQTSEGDQAGTLDDATLLCKALFVTNRVGAGGIEYRGDREEGALQLKKKAPQDAIGTKADYDLLNMMAFVSKRFGAANIIVSNAPQSDELDVFIVDEELPPEMLVTPQAGNDDDERCMPVQVEGEHLLYNATTALLRATSLVPRDHLVAHEFRKTCVAYAMELIVQNRTDFHELIAAFAPYADPEVEAAYPGAAAAVEDLYDRANLEHLKVIDDLLDEGDQEGAFKYGLAMMHLAYVILVKYPCVPSLAGRAESALERYYPIAQKIDAGRADEYLRQQGEVCAATIAELVEVTSAEVVAGFQKMKYIAERLPQGPLEAQTPAPAQARVTPLALLH